MSNNMQQGYGKLRQAIAQSGVKPSSQPWLVKALDPFHNNPIRPDGLPDHFDGKTIVREVTRTVTVTRPGFAGTTWNLRVDMFPLLKQESVTGAIADYVGHFLTENPLNTIISPVNIYLLDQNEVAYPSGTNLNMTTTGTRVLQALNPSNEIDVNAASHRVLAAGFQVVNDTQAQFLQGTCRVYRAPEYDHLHDESGPYFERNGGLTINDFAVNEFKFATLPPSSIGEIDDLPQHKTWPAHEGCYCVQRLNHSKIQNFSSIASTKPTIWTNSSATFPDPAVAVSSKRYKGFTRWSATAQDQLDGDISTILGLHTSGDVVGAYFTNLSNESTFTITAKWLIETVPDANTDLWYTASMTAQHDLRALELYSATVDYLPAGVYVRYNPFGEWFKDAMSFLGEVAKTVGPIVGTLLPLLL